MKFYVLTLFPEMITEGLSHSVIGRAIKDGTIELEAINIRDFANNRHNSVDDYPYGGGAGMVMQAPPIYNAYLSIKDRLSEDCRVVYMTPQGRPFKQAVAEELSQERELVILCGHYEGVDERVIEEIVTDEISIGDYVLTGGELAAMAVIDSVSRLIPGVLNKEQSHMDESFSDNLLEYPQYTRPPEFLGRKVPDVLLSGNHGLVDKWRREKSIERTLKKRPELLQDAKLTDKEREYLNKLKSER